MRVGNWVKHARHIACAALHDFAREDAKLRHGLGFLVWVLPVRAIQIRTRGQIPAISF